MKVCLSLQTEFWQTSPHVDGKNCAREHWEQELISCSGQWARLFVGVSLQQQIL
jgi:hypothetical protein